MEQWMEWNSIQLWDLLWTGQQTAEELDEDKARVPWNVIAEFIGISGRPSLDSFEWPWLTQVP